MTIPDEMIQELRKVVDQVSIDLTSRILYSTDASIYQVEPLGVVYPRNPDELAAAVEIASRFGIPVLARGSGSSVGGQAIGPAMILDCSRYLNKIIEIDPEQRIACVEPGVILTSLNRMAAVYGLQFGPDPASADRATIGGSLANNATGAHSIIYGMAADHLLSAEVVLADGSLAEFKPLDLQSAIKKSHASTLLGEFYKAALDIRAHNGEAIRKNWPHTWRNASGYPLNYLLPWSPSAPPRWGDQLGGLSSKHIPYPPIADNHVNLASILAGSEGTLAIIRRAKLHLVPLQKHTLLGVIAFPSLLAACNAAPLILEHNPSAVELIPGTLVRLARSIPAYASKFSFINQLDIDKAPEALLVVEFSGDNDKELKERAKRLGPDVRLAESKESQAQVWAVRKVGLGILNSRPGNLKPIAFIEDIAVPIENLGEFVQGMEQIIQAHHTIADYYGHASAGCLHIRPIIDLKSAAGKTSLRGIASQAVELAIKLGGSASGEHGDGLARSEWLEKVFGIEIVTAFRQLKMAADPQGILNPGKIVPAPGKSAVPEMDDNLRYGDGYHPRVWQPVFDYARHADLVISELEGEAGLVAAIEMCNGAGVCRKTDGVMCPSFQVTHDEKHSTRGRANLLRAMMTGRFPNKNVAEKIVYEALDLCLACKGCKSECPTGVDVAKLKYEFLSNYYSEHKRRLRDYLFGYIGTVARFAHLIAPLANSILSNSLFIKMSAGVGLTPYRSFPNMSWRSLRSIAREYLAGGIPSADSVLFLSDAFTNYFHPQVGLSAIQVLRAAGYRVHLLPVSGAGRTLISKGFLEAAKNHALSLLDAIKRIDPKGELPVVGLEPSEILTLRDEYFDLLPSRELDEQIYSLAARSFCIDEFLLRPGKDGKPRIFRVVDDLEIKPSPCQILLHGHCYQKAQPPAADGYPTGVAATIGMLEAAGYIVELIEAGCCGMAGAFGYEAEHFDLSMQVGELGLFPSIRQSSPDVVIAAAGVSCQAQIRDGTKRSVVHPVTLLDGNRVRR
jgi:FAD/FMN-containing dehydrogenase/Fe-S oxidoreductase